MGADGACLFRAVGKGHVGFSVVFSAEILQLFRFFFFFFFFFFSLRTAHQVYGDQDSHGQVRELCMDYMVRRTSPVTLCNRGGFKKPIEFEAHLVSI